MIAGCAAFARNLGHYPRSGSVIPLMDCAPFNTSRLAVLFTPDQPLPDALLIRIIRTRRAELTSGNGTS